MRKRGIANGKENKKVELGRLRKTERKTKDDLEDKSGKVYN